MTKNELLMLYLVRKILNFGKYLQFDPFFLISD